MGVNYSTEIYALNYNYWSRPVTFYPIKSQPSIQSYHARGIFATVSVDIVSADASNISEQRTILDILESEFVILPTQQDRVYIGVDTSGMRAEGMFEVNDVSTNGGGETTLELRKLLVSSP